MSNKDPENIKANGSDVEEELSEPDVFRILFRESLDPHFLLDLESGEFVEVNPAFETITGYSREELLEGTVSVEELVSDKTLNLLRLAQKSPDRVPRGRFNLTAEGRNGEPLDMEVTISPVQFVEKVYLHGLARDLSDEKEELDELRQQLDEAMRSNNQMLALNEKIKEIPILTSDLLDLSREEKILNRAQERLRERRGLNYSEATFYLFDDERKQLLPFDTSENQYDRVHVESDDPVARTVQGEEDFLRPEEDLFFLPIEGSKRCYGVMKVKLNSHERELMELNDTAWDGYTETMVTLSNLLGLILQSHRLTKKVQEQAIRDELTTIHNRRYFNQKLEDELNRAIRYEHSISLLVIDVDNFKEINDTYGHLQGDNVLKNIARTLVENCRSSDVVCRYGGDEFGLILPETDLENAKKKAEMILETFEDKPITVKTSDGMEDQVFIELSIGLSYLPEHSTFEIPMEWTGEIGGVRLLRAADQSMYEAKASDTEKLVIHDDPMFTDEDNGFFS